MKVLVVGGGGRCHAIADALRRSPKVEKIYVAPGNAGTAEVAENVPLKDTVRSFAAIVDGEADDLPEWAFFNVGTLEDARQKAAEKGGAV